MTPLDLFLRTCYAGFSLILLSVSVLAFKRYGEARLGIVVVAFAIFSVVSILVLASGFLEWNVFEMSSYLVAFNIGILLCLYLAMLKR
jgi:hypothetical protein